MKKVMTLLILIMSFSLFSEPIEFICAGRGVTESGRNIFGLLQVSIDVEKLKEAFDTNDEAVISQAIPGAIKLLDVSYGKNMEEHNDILKDVLKNYLNADPEYKMLPALSGFNLNRRNEGIYEMKHSLLVYQPGSDEDRKAIILLEFSAEDERLKF